MIDGFPEAAIAEGRANAPQQTGPITSTQNERSYNVSSKVILNSIHTYTRHTLFIMISLSNVGLAVTTLILGV